MPASPTSITIDTVLSASERVLVRAAGSEAVLLDLDSEEFFGLDGVGARTFELLSEARSVEQVAEALLLEYDVEREVLIPDLLAVIDAMAVRRLVVVHG